MINKIYLTKTNNNFQIKNNITIILKINIKNCPYLSKYFKSFKITHLINKHQI